MKKIFILFLLLILCGCSLKVQDETRPAVTENKETEKTEVKQEEADIDLSFGSETIAYATISNILEDPEEYMGQRVKMLGTYKQFYSETYDTTYYVCMVTDATACCQQGMEFKLKDEGSLPLDGQQIILEGIVDVYPEGEYWYAYLKDAAYKVY